MKHLLLIIHAPSANTMILSDAAHAAAQAASEGLSISLRRPTEISAADLFECDGVVIGTLENIGAMAGLTKDMFDRCYNDWLGKTEGLPVAFYIRAGLDGTATKRQLEAIASAQKWRLVQEVLILHGSYDPSFEEAVAKLTGAMAAGLEMGLF